MRCPPSPSPLQAEQPQLSQPFLTGDVFQSSEHFCGLLWTCSNRSVSFHVGSGLQCVIQLSKTVHVNDTKVMQSHQVTENFFIVAG